MFLPLSDLSSLRGHTHMFLNLSACVAPSLPLGSTRPYLAHREAACERTCQQGNASGLLSPVSVATAATSTHVQCCCGRDVRRITAEPDDERECPSAAEDSRRRDRARRPIRRARNCSIEAPVPSELCLTLTICACVPW